MKKVDITHISGAGVLKRIVVNKIGTSSNTCTIYDNTTATDPFIVTGKHATMRIFLE